MTLKLSTFGFEKDPDHQERIKKLEGLCSDLRGLQEGQLPTPAGLAGSPVIHNWRVMMDFHLALYGEVRNHPVLTGPRRIMTSELIVDARDLGWMRTVSRYYLLGRPLPEDATYDGDHGGHLRLV